MDEQRLDPVAGNAHETARRVIIRNGDIDPCARQIALAHQRGIEGQIRRRDEIVARSHCRLPDREKLRLLAGTGAPDRPRRLPDTGAFTRAGGLPGVHRPSPRDPPRHGESLPPVP